MNIRPFRDTDSLEALTELLHRSYRSLADLGLEFLATRQDIGTTRRRVERGICFLAELDGSIVGTITYYPPGRSKGSPWLERPDVACMGQLAVDPTQRGRGIATALLRHAEEQARQDKASELALDTAEPAGHLVGWYERLDYRFIEFADWEVTNYRSVVMSKKL